MLVEVDDLRTLLEAEIDGEIGSLATAERDRLLDMIGDARPLLRRVEDDAHGRRCLAENRLIGTRHRDEIVEVYDVTLRRGAAFDADDRAVCFRRHAVIGTCAASPVSPLCGRLSGPARHAGLGQLSHMLRRSRTISCWTASFFGGTERISLGRCRLRPSFGAALGINLGKRLDEQREAEAEGRYRQYRQLL
jgi:hypothetical protein